MLCSSEKPDSATWNIDEVLAHFSQPTAAYDNVVTLVQDLSQNS